MADYKEMIGTIEVPPNTGVEGFVHALKSILKKSRVQHVEIDARGQVKYRRFIINGEDDGGPNNNFGVDFKSLNPYFIVRNSRIIEFMPPGELAAPVVLGLMFERSSRDQMHPLSFVTGAASVLWEWYRFTTGHIVEERNSLFGLKVLYDRQVPDTALLLCAGYGKDAEFIDTQVSYKVEMPVYQTPTTDVEELP